MWKFVRILDFYSKAAKTFMKSYKAPGPDGFFFPFLNSNPSFDSKAAKTFMVFITKEDRPTSFKDFRPMTLCNVIHKLINF